MSIAGEKFLITSIDIWADEDGYIHIRQEPDPSYEDRPNVIIFDRSRSIAVLRALQEAIAAQSEGFANG